MVLKINQHYIQKNINFLFNFTWMFLCRFLQKNTCFELHNQMKIVLSWGIKRSKMNIGECNIHKRYSIKKSNFCCEHICLFVGFIMKEISQTFLLYVFVWFLWKESRPKIKSLDFLKLFLISRWYALDEELLNIFIWKKNKQSFWIL